MPVSTRRRPRLSTSAMSLGSLSHSRALSSYRAFANDRVDAGNFPLGFCDFAWCLQPLGRGLEPQMEQVLLQILERQFQLLGTHAAIFLQFLFHALTPA